MTREEQATDPAHPAAAAVDVAPEGETDDEEQLPSLSEQVAQQLGGWRGLAEASIPVVVFVVVNVIAGLNPAIAAACAVAVGIAGWRLIQRRPIRHAVNGLVGIGIGAFIALRSGEARDFYLPGILFGYAYGAALLLSVAIRKPLVGWLWSVLVAGGRSDWQREPRLVSTFNWLTILWGSVWMAKVGIQHALYAAHMDTVLGAARLALGYPPYALLLLITIWTVRRVTRSLPSVVAA